MTARALLPWLLGAIIVLLSAALLFALRDELGLDVGPNEDQPAARSTSAGGATLRLGEEALKTSGIATAALQATQLVPATEVFAVVVNPAPLLEARARYLAARAELDGARAAVTQSTREYARLKDLNADDRNVSDRALQAAAATMSGSGARLTGLERTAAGQLDSLRAQWGDALARLASDPRSSFFSDLSAQRLLLVQVTLPAGAESPAPGTAVSLTPVAMAATRRPAVLISIAPFADTAVPGATYLARMSPAPELRIGTRLKGKLPRGGEPRAGVAIPASAVVHHGGKAWVYVNEGEGVFERREVETRHEADGGWFNGAGFEPGDKVVVSGAQLLLSEELRYQIRNENED